MASPSCSTAADGVPPSGAALGRRLLLEPFDLALEDLDAALDLVLVRRLRILGEVALVVVDRLRVRVDVGDLLPLHVVGGADVVEELREGARVVRRLEPLRGRVEVALEVLHLRLIEGLLGLLQARVLCQDR